MECCHYFFCHSGTSSMEEMILSHITHIFDRCMRIFGEHCQLFRRNSRMIRGMIKGQEPESYGPKSTSDAHDVENGGVTTDRNDHPAQGQCHEPTEYAACDSTRRNDSSEYSQTPQFGAAVRTLNHNSTINYNIE